MLQGSYKETATYFQIAYFGKKFMKILKLRQQKLTIIPFDIVNNNNNNNNIHFNIAKTNRSTNNTCHIDASVT